MRFIDTNILLYAVSTVVGEFDKATTARRILEDDDLALSVQVLQEFYVQATRASRSDPLSHDLAGTLIEGFLRFRVQDLTVDIVQAALETRERFQLSYWDAAILEAAKACGCIVVLSEDLNSGQDYGGVYVENPFKT